MDWYYMHMKSGETINSKSSFPALQSCQNSLGLNLSSFWSGVGDAPMGCRLIGLQQKLESKYGSFNNGSYMHNMVCVCARKQQNATNFENHVKLVDDLTSTMLNLMSGRHFRIVLVFLIQILCAPLIYIPCTWVVPLCMMNNIDSFLRVFQP